MKFIAFLLIYFQNSISDLRWIFIMIWSCVWQEGAGNVLFHGEDAGQHAGRLWDESGEGGPGATKQA